jgi:uncharacterized damage-inducible protein DinB
VTALDEQIRENHEAVNRLVTAAEALPSAAWDREAAPGKWSPAQIAEHVALSYELSTAALRGAFPGTAAPRFLRPLIRMFFLKPVLASGRFARPAKAPGPFQPSTAPSAAALMLPRIRGASAAFEQAIAGEVSAGRDTMDHPFFGRVPLADYVQLQAIHTNHHRGQLPS